MRASPTLSPARLPAAAAWPVTMCDVSGRAQAQAGTGVQRAQRAPAAAPCPLLYADLLERSRVLQGLLLVIVLVASNMIIRCVVEGERERRALQRARQAHWYYYHLTTLFRPLLAPPQRWGADAGHLGRLCCARHPVSVRHQQRRRGGHHVRHPRGAVLHPALRHCPGQRNLCPRRPGVAVLQPRHRRLQRRAAPLGCAHPPRDARVGTRSYSPTPKRCCSVQSPLSHLHVLLLGGRRARRVAKARRGHAGHHWLRGALCRPGALQRRFHSHWVGGWRAHVRKGRARRPTRPQQPPRPCAALSPWCTPPWSSRTWGNAPWCSPALKPAWPSTGRASPRRGGLGSTGSWCAPVGSRTRASTARAQRPSPTARAGGHRHCRCHHRVPGAHHRRLFHHPAGEGGAVAAPRRSSPPSSPPLPPYRPPPPTPCRPSTWAVSRA